MAKLSAQERQRRISEGLKLSWKRRKNKMIDNPLDKLSYEALYFLRERTDFTEPFLGYGFPSIMLKEIDAALSRKEETIKATGGTTFIRVRNPSCDL